MNLHASSPETPSLTKKNFWVAAYLAALHRVPPAEAKVEADEALRIADERWQWSDVVAEFRNKHDFEIGHAFPQD